MATQMEKAVFFWPSDFDGLIEIVPYETTGGKLDDAEQQAHHSDGTEKENGGVFPCFDNVHGGGAGDHDKRAAP